MMSLPDDFPITTISEENKKTHKAQKSGPVEPVNEELYNKLKDLRKALAAEEGLPPYVVATNVLLNEMCIHLPTTEAEMLQVKGMGKVRFDQYGQAFIRAIQDWKKGK